MRFCDLPCCLFGGCLGNHIRKIAQRYEEKYEGDILSNVRLKELYISYLQRSQASLLDALVAVAAVNSVFLSDQVNQDAVSPQMQEAFDLAHPNLTLDQLPHLEKAALNSMMGSWKGKYFEIELRDRLNKGDGLGGIRLGEGQYAELAPDLTQPGWDLAICNADGTLDTVLQAKATDSMSYIRQALEKYPEIEVVATEEVASKLIDEVINSEIENKDLEDVILAPMKNLMDGPLEEVLETVSPVLPVVIISMSEGRKVLLGRQTFQVALKESLERALKSGVAIGIGGILALLNAGIISLPTTLLAHIGIDRHQNYKRLNEKINKDINELRCLGDSV